MLTRYETLDLATDLIIAHENLTAALQRLDASGADAVAVQLCREALAAIGEHRPALIRCRAQSHATITAAN